ncbi:TolC family protein [uncultured Lutibacter sp.]|uniref:TolC family protein n=1 Tax=Lutibacter sp. TaxID=1925666 RepID=UPI002633DEBF|nr:TolC family protein [uncultured Lutibacter sp.]
MRSKIVTILALVFFITVQAQDKKWTLQECVNYALENNISIKQQELNKELIEEDIITAEGNFYPSLNASASQNFNFGSYIDNYGGRVSRDSRSNSFSLGTGVTLYNGQRNKNTLLRAQKNLEAAGFDLEENKNNIMLFVVNSYLNVLLNKESLKIAEEQVSISESQVEKVKNLVEAGSQPKANLFEAQATLATNTQQLVTAQNNLDLSLLSLAQLLQISHKGFDVEDVVLNINAASLIYNDTDVIYNTALGNLPEIKSAEIAVENSEVAIDIAKGAFLPSLSFSAGLGTSYQHNQGQKDVRAILDENNNVVYVPNGFGKQLEDNLGYNFGFSLNIPIFNRFQTKSNVARAQINKERFELALLDKQVKLRETIEKAYADAKASLNQFVAAEQSLKAQEESFKNAQVSYNSGVMTSFDFDQVRNRLVNSQSSLINAKYNFVFRTKLLEYYLGIPIVID